MLGTATSRFYSRIAHALRVRVEWIDAQLRWRVGGAYRFSPAAVEANVAQFLLSFTSITGNRTFGGNGTLTSTTGNAAITGNGSVRGVGGNRGVAGKSSNAAAISTLRASHSLPSVSSPLLP